MFLLFFSHGINFFQSTVTHGELTHKELIHDHLEIWLSQTRKSLHEMARQFYQKLVSIAS